MVAKRLQAESAERWQNYSVSEPLDAPSEMRPVVGIGTRCLRSADHLSTFCSAAPQVWQWLRGLPLMRVAFECADVLPISFSSPWETCFRKSSCVVSRTASTQALIY